MSSTAAPAHEVIVVPDQGRPDREKLRQECYDVRIAVFVDEQKFPLDVEIDDIDEYGTHFLLRLVPSLEPIGTIRAHLTPGGYYKLSRLAILAPYRKYGLGRTLVTALNNWVRENAAASGATAAKIVLHSQLPPIKFYEKFGYVAEGPQFDEDGAPHQRMVLDLAW